MRLEPPLRAEITLAAAQELGDTPHGRRRVVPITGGSFRGERLSPGTRSRRRTRYRHGPALYYMRWNWKCSRCNDSGDPKTAVCPCFFV